MAISETISYLALLVLIIPGFVTAFYGWKIHESLIALAGFITGVILGISFSLAVVIGEGGGAAGDSSGLLFLVIVIAFGIGMSEVFKAMERLAVAIPGFLLGSLLGVLVTQGSMGEILSPIPLIFGLAVGLLFWWGYVAGIILYTAFFGAFLVSIGMMIWNGQWYGLFDTSRLFSGFFWLIFLTGGGVQAGVIAKFEGFGERDIESVSEVSLTEAISNTKDRAKDTHSFKKLLDGKGSEAIDNCPKCDTNCLPTDAYCQGCGAALNHCDTCGTVGLEDWEFCNQCGESIN